MLKHDDTIADNWMEEGNMEEKKRNDRAYIMIQSDAKDKAALTRDDAVFKAEEFAEDMRQKATEALNNLRSRRK